MTIPNLALWGKKKGIHVLGTGDFTHPKWLEHLRQNLEPAEPGLYKVPTTLNSGSAASCDVRFMVTTEISSIYSHGGKVRRVHNLVFAPSLEAAEKINGELAKRGAKLASDGRPIVGISSRDLLNLVLSVSSDCLFVPAHAWTPWFAVFGSRSGYDSLEECFGEDAKYIYAIETGLSSDIEMNWRLSKLDRVTLISNSDPHSLRRLGRECNVFEIAPEKLSYAEIARIIRETDKEKFLFTVEYFPEEGRYHYDGHSDHKVVLHPSQSKKLKQRCPKCERPLTVGVLSRVEELADRPEGFVPERHIPGRHMVQLEEIIANSLGLRAATGKAVVSLYEKMVNESFRCLPAGRQGEMGILLDATVEQIGQMGNPLVGEGVKRVREGRLKISPGYDGAYGQIEIFSAEERKAYAGSKTTQTALF